MSVCIIYASKYGSAKKVAGLISEKLGGCDIFNIAEDSFDLSKYNFVIIGSDIRMGTVDKLITKLLFRFIKPLSERKCAYFLTCIFPENGDGYFKRNIPSQLLSEAVAVAKRIFTRRFRSTPTKYRILLINRSRNFKLRLLLPLRNLYFPLFSFCKAECLEVNNS